MGGCYNTIDLDRSPAKLGNWYHTYTCMLSTKSSYQTIKLQFKNKKTVPFIWSMCISQYRYTLIFNLEQMTSKSNNNFIKRIESEDSKTLFSILHKLRRTGFFGNGRSVIRYKPNGSNKRSMNYLKLQAIIIFNDLGLIYLAGNRSYIRKLERTG